MNSPNLRVVIFFNKLHNYRIPFLENLVKKRNIALTVVSSLEFKTESVRSELFEEIYLEQKKLFGFSWYKMNDIKRLASDSDAVIMLFSIRNMDALLLSMFSRLRKKVLLWGIGVSGSYTKPFGILDIPTIIRVIWAKRVAGLILYSDYASNTFRFLGLDPKKVFTARNTISNFRNDDVLSLVGSKVCKNILFVGTLYPEKGLESLLCAFLRFIESQRDTRELPRLIIVGDGPEGERLKELVRKTDLSKVVDFLGRVEDRVTLNKLFDNSIACISLKQAGLTVLESFSNGVPFVTCEDAITGGEKFSIEHKVNGLILSEDYSIDVFFKQVMERPEFFVDLGKQAYLDYITRFSPCSMVENFSRAIVSVAECRC